MLLYDVAAVAILAFAGFGFGLHGVALSSGGSPRGNDRLLCRVPAAQALKCDDGEELVKHIGLSFVGASHTLVNYAKSNSALSSALLSA